MAKLPSVRCKRVSISPTAPPRSPSHGPDATNGQGPRRRSCRIARQRLDRDHFRLPQRRRGHPKGRTGDFFDRLPVQFRPQYCAALRLILRRLRRLGHRSGPSSAARGQGVNPAGLVAPLPIRKATRIADVKQRRRLAVGKPILPHPLEDRQLDRQPARLVARIVDPNSAPALRNRDRRAVKLNDGLLENLAVIGHVRTPKVGVQLSGVSSECRRLVQVTDRSSGAL